MSETPNEKVIQIASHVEQGKRKIQNCVWMHEGEQLKGVAILFSKRYFIYHLFVSQDCSMMYLVDYYCIF